MPTRRGGEWREYFRGTSAHNTIVVDGQHQSEIQGDFLWGRKANTHLLHWRTDCEYDLVVAEHDGYQHLGLIHRRSIVFFKPDALIVIDDLLGSGIHTYEQLWHLPGKSKLTPQGLSVKTLIDDVQCSIELLEPAEAALTLYCGNEDPIQGWVSPHYGHLESAPVVGFGGHTNLPTRLTTYIGFSDSLSTTDVHYLKKKAHQLVSEVNEVRS